LPEWQDERQTGYAFWPTFGAGQPWAQNLNIRLVETPDLAAYLISEAESLRKIGDVLEQVAANELDRRVHTLLRRLSTLWDDKLNRFVYRDRDTLVTSGPVTIIENVPADEEHLPALKLETPARIIVQVSGGTG